MRVRCQFRSPVIRPHFERRFHRSSITSWLCSKRCIHGSRNLRLPLGAPSFLRSHNQSGLVTHLSLCYNRNGLMQFGSGKLPFPVPPVPWNDAANPSMTDNLDNPIKASARSSDIASTSSRGSNRTQAGDDRILLDRVSERDDTAMTELFDRYGSMVYSVALRVLKDPGSAEDVMQDVFFQVWENPGAFVLGRGSLGAWLMVVARNRAIDALRRRRPSDPVEDVVLASGTNLASEAERNTMMEKVRGVLSGLPTDQQRSLELAFFEGLSHSEIAAKTGDPLGTVKTRIRSALISVRKAFQA
jgi:RNA polymerase sigma-70 factor (ECF subfamily)